MSIFVSIASYSDPVLPFTIRRALERARWPDSLHFGIVDQSPSELLYVPAPEIPADQISLVHINPVQTRGACWARALAQNFYRGQKWFLQLDSHMEFEQDWDAILIGQAESIQASQPRFVISSYPAPFVFENGEPVRKPTTQKILAHLVKPTSTFDGSSPVLSFHAVPVERDAPVRGFHLGAGCVFAPGEFAHRFPYDPWYYFHGEEQALAIRLFTHGWDIFHTSGLPISHLYNDVEGNNRRPMHWNAEDDAKRAVRWTALDLRSKARLASMLFEGNDLGVFGLGRERSLEDYSNFCGINYPQRQISAVAYEGPWRGKRPLTSFAPLTSPQVLFRRTYQMVSP